MVQIGRRSFTLGAGALWLGACSGPSIDGSTTKGPSSVPEDLKPVQNREYDAWVVSFRERAAAQGLSQTTLNKGFHSAGYLPGVVTRDRNQPESSRSLEDYLSIAASDERVEKGRRAFASHQKTLQGLEARYGVDAEIIAAIWGLESFFGERRGNVPVISATSTLAYDGRRGSFFEKQLVAALRILQSGDVAPRGLTGSWAGAMGHTQFIPTSYLAYAVDYDSDGRRDIWSEDPTDALASTAAYLSRSGWTRGQKWGGEVGNGAPGGSIIQPQPGGPQFSVTGNFRAIKRYNNSDLYAIGVGHLADRIAGGGPIRASFPPDENGMMKSDRMSLQRKLTARGYDTGGADGVIGPKTEEAIRAYQRDSGRVQTGTPTLVLLGSL